MGRVMRCWDSIETAASRPMLSLRLTSESGEELVLVELVRGCRVHCGGLRRCGIRGGRRCRRRRRAQVFPVGSGANLVDNLCVDRPGPFLEREEPALYWIVAVVLPFFILISGDVGVLRVGVDDVDVPVRVVTGLIGEESDSVDVCVEAFVV